MNFRKNIFKELAPMSFVLTLILLLSPTTSFAQDFECGTIDDSPVINSVTCDGPLENIVNNDNTVNTSPIKEVPIVFHLLHDGPTNFISDFEDRVNNLFQEINNGFAGTNGTTDTRIRFVRAQTSPDGECDKNGINYIDDPLFTDYAFTTDLANNPAYLAYADAYIDKTQEEFWNGCINVFIAADNNCYGGSNCATMGSGRVSIKQFNGFFGTGTLIHELGHVLGLGHTFANECDGAPITGANCATTGDYICDTPPHANCGSNPSEPLCIDPADPNGNQNDCGFISLCDPNYNYTTSAINNIVRNYMAYGNCKDKFSIGQRARMNALLSHKKCDYTFGEVDGFMFGFGPIPTSISSVSGFYDFSYLLNPQNYLALGIIGADAANPINEIITIEAGTTVDLNCDIYFGPNGGIHVEYGATLNLNNANLIPTSGSWQNISYCDSDQIFIDYPGLTSVVDPNNCTDEVITAYATNGTGTFIYVATASGGTLYYHNGNSLQSYCTDSPTTDCVSAYDLTDVAASWMCGGSPICEAPLRTTIAVDNRWCDGTGFRLRIGDEYSGQPRQFQYKRDDNTVWQETQVVNNMVIISGLQPCTKYNVQVKVLCDNGAWSDYSDTRNIWTHPERALANQMSVTLFPCSNPNFGYLRCIGYNGDKKQFRYRKVNFSNQPLTGWLEGGWLNSDSNVSGSDYLASISELELNSRYEYQVKVRCGQTGVYSCVQKIYFYHSSATCKTDGTALEAPKDFTVYPNPTKDVINIDLNIDEIAETIQVYDLQGRLVQEWNTQDIQGHSFQLDLSELKAGMYMLRINDIHIKKITKL